MKIQENLLELDIFYFYFKSYENLQEQTDFMKKWFKYRQLFLIKKYGLPQIGAAKFIVLGSKIVDFGQQLRYFFGQLNYLFWTANLFFWAARFIIWAAKFIKKSAKFINGQQLFFLLIFR
jgi:hypothetical protein